MNSKNIAALLLMVATALGGPVAVDHALNVNEEVVAAIAIDGPTEAVVGELVVLDLSGSRGSWLMPTTDYLEVTSNRVVLTFRKNGTYEVVASANAGGNSAIVKHVIEVGKDPTSVLVPNDNTVPTPDVVPVPTPEPVVVRTYADDVYDWCREENAPKATCKTLGDNFIDAATNANSIDDLLSRVATANRKVNQKGVERVLGQIQQLLFDNLSDKDLEAHRCAFSEIGDGLVKWSDGAVGSQR